MMKKRNYHAISNIEEALQTFRQRNKTYGDSYLVFGKVMQALYPKGVTIETEEQWNRFGVIQMIVSKLTRYVATPTEGHLDSAHDMGVYSHILEELDAAMAGMPTHNPIRRQEFCEHAWEDGVCRMCGGVQI